MTPFRVLPLLLGSVFGISLLYALRLRAGTDRPAAPERVLVVNAFTPEPQDHYRESRWILGEVKAGRRTELGFETAGRVERILVDEGDWVEAGALLAELDRARVLSLRESALAQLRQAEAEKTLALETREKTEKLFASRVVSQQGWDEVRRRAEVQEAVYERMRAELGVIDAILRETRLHAPFAGRVLRRSRDEGAVLAPGEALLDLLGADALELHVSLPSTLADALAPGQSLEAVFQSATFQVGLRAILGERNAATQRVRAIFRIAEAPVPPALRPGDLVRLRIGQRIEGEGAWLPLAALTEGSRGVWTAYTLRPLAAETPGGATHEVDTISLHWLAAREGEAFLRGPIPTGALLVRDGLHRIVPGQRVRVAAPEGAVHASR